MSVPLQPPARRPPRCPLQRRWAVTPRGQPKLTRLRFVMEMLAGSFGSEVRCGGALCPALPVPFHVPLQGSQPSLAKPPPSPSPWLPDEKCTSRCKMSPF